MVAGPVIVSPVGGKYAVMWSGGKDSALVLNRARASDLDVQRLLTFYDSASGRVRFHATTVAMIQAQAEAIGVELRPLGTSWQEMENALTEQLEAHRREGFSGVVFGDIHLTDVRAWYEQRVTRSGLEHVEPIWGDPPANLLREFVESGGRAVVTCVDLDRLDPSWLGRIVDQSFVAEIVASGVDPCGENGEYHSYAFDGPVFKQPVGWRLGERRSDGRRFAQLDLLPA